VATGASVATRVATSSSASLTGPGGGKGIRWRGRYSRSTCSGLMRNVLVRNGTNHGRLRNFTPTKWPLLRSTVTSAVKPGFPTSCAKLGSPDGKRTSNIP